METETTVTIWTNTTDRGSPEKLSTESESTKTIFHSKEFRHSNAKDIKPYLQSQHKLAKESKNTLITVIQSNGLNTWLPNALIRSLSGFPLDLLSQFYQRTTALARPVGEVHDHGVVISMRYPAVSPKFPGVQEVDDNFDNEEIRSLPISTWICSEHALDNSSSTPEPTPIIIILCINDTIRTALENHYHNVKHVQRLNNSPAWIYFDLAYSLAKWDAVWELTAANIFKRDAQAHGEVQAPSAIELSKQLHRDTADVIGLKEGVRLHLAALSSFKSTIKAQMIDKGDNRRSLLPETKIALVTPRERDLIEFEISKYFQVLKHYKETSDVVLKQLETLLSLVFNTETALQGQSVAKLNTLAVIFLPLTYVAAIFGMTTFTAHVRWYPVWAAVAMVAVASAVMLGQFEVVHKTFDWIHNSFRSKKSTTSSMQYIASMSSSPNTKETSSVQESGRSTQDPTERSKDVEPGSSTNFQDTEEAVPQWWPRVSRYQPVSALVSLKRGDPASMPSVGSYSNSGRTISSSSTPFKRTRTIRSAQSDFERMSYGRHSADWIFGSYSVKDALRNSALGKGRSV